MNFLVHLSLSVCLIIFLECILEMECYKIYTHFSGFLKNSFKLLSQFVFYIQCMIVFPVTTLPIITFFIETVKYRSQKYELCSQTAWDYIQFSLYQFHISLNMPSFSVLLYIHLLIKRPVMLLLQDCLDISAKNGKEQIEWL